MRTAEVKTELRRIANALPEGSSYSDAMYELYVRMKVARGREAAAQGRVLSHAELKRQYGL